MFILPEFTMESVSQNLTCAMTMTIPWELILPKQSKPCASSQRWKIRVVRKAEVTFKTIKYVNKENHFCIWIYSLTRCSPTFLVSFNQRYSVTKSRRMISKIAIFWQHFSFQRSYIYMCNFYPIRGLKIFLYEQGSALFLENLSFQI